jgi:hypothetical protein
MPGERGTSGDHAGKRGGELTMSTRCNCMYEAGEHKVGMGKCPYGDAAIFPHPDGVPRMSEKANAVLHALVSLSHAQGIEYQALAAALHCTSDSAVAKMRRMPQAKLVALINFHFSTPMKGQIP